MAGGVVAGRLRQRTLPVGPQLERDDEHGDRRHGQDRVQRRPAVPAQPGHEGGARHHGDGDLHVAEVGEEVGQRGGPPSGQRRSEPLVGAEQRAVGHHLPGDQREDGQQRGHPGKEKDRPPGNWGECSGVAGLTGVPRAPGGVGRATVRSVRSSGARCSSGVRGGTAGTVLGEPRPGVTRSSLRAGCFSHLWKPYVRGEWADRGHGNPPWPPHTFFTDPHAQPVDVPENAARPQGESVRIRAWRTPVRECRGPRSADPRR